ncbi:MAG: DUF559 domain-containing protein [Sporichthyaceae bacterium]
MEDPRSRRARREARHRRAVDAARPRGGVIGRAQLFELGVERWELDAELRSGRWLSLGKQTVRITDGDRRLASWWRAVLEVSPAAVLDGVSAMQAAGLRGIESEHVHVAVPKSARPRRCRGVVVHETRRFELSSVVDDAGIPRMRPETGAVHAALWARSDREAALFVIAGAQQRLFTAQQYAEEVVKVRRDARRRLLRQLHADIAGGIEALGERDFARLCAQRTFPVPTRQLRRQTESGSWRYDVVWEEYTTTVELNGSHHLAPEQAMKDALKENAMRLAGHVVVRIPNLALRVDPAPFLDQIDEALRRGGWAGPGRLSA